MAMPSPVRAKRCVYREGNRRCTFAGKGEPALCDPHRMAVAQAAQPRSPISVLTEAAADFMSGRPINREATIGAAENLFQQWAGSMGSQYRPDMFDGASENTVHRRAQAGAGPTTWEYYRQMFEGRSPPRQGPMPPPPPSPDVEQERRIRAARLVLGFTPNEPLDADKVNQVHRRLVRKNHPDLKQTPAEKARATEKMMAINNARDVLLAVL